LVEVSRTVLLVVDDESSVCRAIKRLLKNKVDEILTAQTPADAETILRSRAVTHVICDQLLGPSQPLGTDLSRGWKERYPSIRRIAILTGTNVGNIARPEGVDHVLAKTTDPVKLAELMGFGER